MAARSRNRAAPKKPVAQKSNKQAGARRPAGRPDGLAGLQDAVNQVWLAGMGALARAQKEGPRAFESMIVEGASLLDKSRGQAEDVLREALATVQATVGGRVKGTKTQAAQTWGALEHLVQGRVQQALRQVGVPTAKDVASLTKRIDELNASVSSLAKSKARAQPKRSAPKKPVRRKAAAAPAAAEPAA